VALRVSATKQVIETNGFASISSFITKANGAQAIMPQFFHLLNMEKEHTLLAKG